MAHEYRLGVKGRSLSGRPGVGGHTRTAQVACSACGADGALNLRTLMPADQIDQKFRQAGWRLDPHVCPACITARKDRKAMSAKPSQAAMRAQAQMIQALADHFDAAQGAYAAGWSDKAIAEKVGLSVDIVTEYRVACFGELKEPEEVRSLRADMKALEELQAEQAAAFAQGLAELRVRLGKLSAKWGA